MQSDEAIIFNESLLNDLGYDGQEKYFFLWLATRSNYGGCNNNLGHLVFDAGSGNAPFKVGKAFANMISLYRPFDELSDKIKSGYSNIPENKWTVVGKRLLKILNGKFDYLWGGRTIRLGQSDEALAWTDGRRHITMDRKWVKGLCLQSSVYGVVELVGVLAHEMAHDEDTRGTHFHSSEFHQKFHNLIVRGDRDRNRPHDIVPQLINDMGSYKLRERQEKEDAKKKKVAEKKKAALGIE